MKHLTIILSLTAVLLLAPAAFGGWDNGMLEDRAGGFRAILKQVFQTPAMQPGVFDRIKGSMAKRNREDNSIWEKGHDRHGGSVFKRWDNEKDWERRHPPMSIREDGTVRMWP